MPLPSGDLAHVFTQVRPELSGFAEARIFLTGGTGFVGRWLTESWAFARRECSAKGELHILSRNPEAFLAQHPHLRTAPGLRFHLGDQGRFSFPEGVFDAVIHAAVSHGSPSETFEANLAGLRRVIHGAGSHGVSRLLLLSSGAVYQGTPARLDAVPESAPLCSGPLGNSTAYGLMKVAAEQLALAFAPEGRPASLIARGFAFVGPGLPLDRNYAIGNFIRDALIGAPLRIKGDGTPLRSYLYASDLAIWLWRILARGRSGDTYNVGSPEALSIQDLAEWVRDTLRPGCQILLEGAPETNLSRARYVPDTRKAEQELGLRPTVSLEEGIRRTAEWARSEGVA